MNGTEILAVFLVALFSLLMVGVPIAFGLLLVSAVLLLKQFHTARHPLLHPCR